MHYANGFLLCHSFLCRDNERMHSHYELLNEQAAAYSFNRESVALLVKIPKLFT